MALRGDYAAPTGLKIILALGSTNMPRLTALGKVGRAIPCPPPLANGRIRIHHDGAHGFLPGVHTARRE